jgi:very-short-patch-repair endonuclease
MTSPDIFIELCKRMGLPAPIAEHRFHPVRKWRFDFSWPEYRLAIEVEGGIYIRGRHTTASGFLKDMEKYNAAACMGWRVLRVTPKSILTLTSIQLIKDALCSAEDIKARYALCGTYGEGAQ